MDVKEKNPLISVIIPVYNVEKYLVRCVESVVNQTYKNLEIILVDDGSPDHCGQICDRLAKDDGRIIVIHQKNMGLSSARNSGIKIAKGEYFTFVDSDDWIVSSMVEDLYRIITDSSSDLAICGMIKTSAGQMNDLKLPKRKEKIYLYDRDSFLKILLRVGSNRCVHYAWGKLFSKKVIELNEHFPRGMLNEDVEGTFKAAILSDKIAETTKIGYCYFQNSESITGKRFGNNYLCLTEVWERILKISENLEKKYYDYVYYNLMRADFTILVDMILYGDSETDHLYEKECEFIKKRLKSNLWELCRGFMPLNRKIMAILVCYLYQPIRKVFRFIRKCRGGKNIKLK